MTGSQYNNVVRYTLANTLEDAAVESGPAVRAALNNCGVAFPHGDNREILLTLMSEEYMGWTACTRRQAQEYANAGIAAIGIDTDRVVVILPDGEPDGAIATADTSVSPFAVRTEELPLAESLSLQYFAYASSTTTTKPTPPPAPAQDIDSLVSWAKGALGKNLQQCSEYFGVSNPNIDWCAWFVRQCGAKANMNFGSSNRAVELNGIYGNVELSDSNKPKVGDLSFVDSSNGYKIGHIGIIVSIDSGIIRSVEGNMTGSISTSTVRQANYSYSTGTDKGWGRLLKFGKNS